MKLLLLVYLFRKFPILFRILFLLLLLLLMAVAVLDYLVVHGLVGV